MTDTAAGPTSRHGLVLRGWRPEDAPTVYAAATDPLIALWNPVLGNPVLGNPMQGNPMLADAASWCAARADWSDGTHASWAIAASDRPDTTVGSVSLYNIDRDQRSCEVGFWVAPASRRQGIASGALQLAADYGFAALELQRIVLFHAVGNVGSCRVSQATGFRLEGTHRESHRYGDGRRHDEHSHARLAADRVTGRGISE